MKLTLLKMLTGSNSQKGFTLNQIMATVGIASIVTVVGFNGFQHAIQTTNETALQQEAKRVHQLMEEIFMNQNPNEYPPEDSLTSGVSGWVAPSNLQAAQELDTIMHRWRSGDRGTVEIAYTYPSPQGYEMTIAGHRVKTVVSPTGVNLLSLDSFTELGSGNSPPNPGDQTGHDS